MLDRLVFDDVAARPLHAALQAGQVVWVATAVMREELVRVLTYPQIVPRLTYYRLSAPDVLGAFDALARLVPVPAKAGPTCKDADDQKFIDLAVAQQASLLSKDQAVLRLKKRLLPLGVSVGPIFINPSASGIYGDLR